MAFAGEYESGDPGANYPDQDPSNPPPGYRWDARTGSFVPIAQPTPEVAQAPTPEAAPYVAPAAPSYSGGGGESMGSLIAPFTGGGGMPAVPSGTNYLPATPEFHAPAYNRPPAFSYDAFQAPTGETVLNEKGFKFGMDQGLQGLQQSAAARGVLNGGGTLKDVAAWAQNYAGQKYGDAYGREANTYGINRANAADTYNKNYQTQYVDPYQFAFQGAQAEFAPKMQGYATQAAAGQRANEFNYGSAFDQYLQKYKEYADSQSLLFNYRQPFLQG